MLNNISWGSYWTALTILAILYYALIVLLFYWHDLQQMLSAKGRLLTSGSSQSGDFAKEGISNNDDGNDLPVEVQSFTQEVGAYLEQAKYAGALKEEILFGAKQILKKYPSLKSSEYQEGINNLLLFESKNKCAIHLNNEELRQVWLD